MTCNYVVSTGSLAVSTVAGADADSWMVGVTVPLFGGRFLGSYQKRDGDTVNVCF